MTVIKYQSGKDHPAWTGLKFSKSLRLRVTKAFKSTCEYCGSLCGSELGSIELLPSVDRIFPKSKGGLYTDENVTLSCLLCNSLKADKDFIGPVRNLSLLETAK